MDPQVRQFRDFLQLYNSITEKCFATCVDTLLHRRVEENENFCILNCVDKFAKVNQRMMTTYVEVQSSINEKRMEEYEKQLKENEAQALQQAQTTEPAPVEVSN
jgi:Tim10/DDP family zinc finger